MKTKIILVAALLAFSAFSQPARAQEYYPGTNTPYNDAWRQTQHDTELEYAIVCQAAVAAAADPVARVRFAIVKNSLETVYRIWFGIDIHPADTVPVAIAWVPDRAHR